MAKLDNPYAGIINLMRTQGSSHNSPDLMLGEVLTPMPLLTISAGGIQLDKDNLLVPDYLLAGHKRTITAAGTLAGGTSSSSVGDHGSHSHSLGAFTETSEITFTDSLKAGDLIALQQFPGTNKFLIYCRVASL